MIIDNELAFWVSEVIQVYYKNVFLSECWDKAWIRKVELHQQAFWGKVEDLYLELELFCFSRFIGLNIHRNPKSDITSKLAMDA